ncbi:MAG: preQ(1) synthase [Thermodesulfobacteriota bacterium]|nr:preQ(1) synthase [Thermodesulfobacteriota bacterium]
MEDLTILGKKTDYTGSPSEAKLETFENKHLNRDYTIQLVCPEFTSICPVTGQPDFATIYITYVPDKRCIESKSLKLYLASYRNTGIFNEHVTNKILDDIVNICNPMWAEVVGKFNVRGGISINITARYEKEKR